MINTNESNSKLLKLFEAIHEFYLLNENDFPRDADGNHASFKMQKEDTLISKLKIFYNQAFESGLSLDEVDKLTSKYFIGNHRDIELQVYINDKKVKENKKENAKASLELNLYNAITNVPGFGYSKELINAFNQKDGDMPLLTIDEINKIIEDSIKYGILKEKNIEKRKKEEIQFNSMLKHFALEREIERCKANPQYEESKRLDEFINCKDAFKTIMSNNDHVIGNVYPILRYDYINKFTSKYIDIVRYF